MLINARIVSLITVLAALLSGVWPASPRSAVLPASQGQSISDPCPKESLPVSLPLTDLGNNVYVRMGGVTTSFTGGLYPNGSNERPAAHTANGMRMATMVLPRNVAGDPDPDGKIGMISLGMSNTKMEFATFIDLAQADPDINPHLVLVNGASDGMVASNWTDPNAYAWGYLDIVLNRLQVSAEQVQIAWIKETNYDLNDFPSAQIQLQADLTTILHNLKAKYPNLVIAYLSSRTRSYKYWSGISPEPGAFETGFAVKWLVEAQINGDPGLNFDPARGAVVAPYISWGPYLWADGHNPRSDGLTWMEADMVLDCTHPSLEGEDKVSHMLLDFLKTDATSSPWFLAAASPPPYVQYIPGLVADRQGTPEPGARMRYFTPR